MEMTILPHRLSGAMTILPSKSQAHRLLICAAFAREETRILCGETNEDMDATAECLRALGADIRADEGGYAVTPVRTPPKQARLDCRESGSTLRFLLPVVGALGVDATFRLAGRLPNRPLSPLWEEMNRMGCTLSRPTQDTVRCQGRLQSGTYALSGGVSSQFITGLLLALPLLDGTSRIRILGRLESRPYVELTLQTMARFGVFASTDRIPGGRPYRSPGTVRVEGDWSNAAFFLAAEALGSPVQVSGLSPDSVQGDQAAAVLLPRLRDGCCQISAADIPDLVPVLAVAAGACRGAVFTEIGRLRLKESDRVASVMNMIRSLGGIAFASRTTLTVLGTGFRGGTVDAARDHRIAMAAAVAATVCQEPVTVRGAEAVAKSYPRFWEVYQQLGGILHEQHLR